MLSTLTLKFIKCLFYARLRSDLIDWKKALPFFLKLMIWRYLRLSGTVSQSFEAENLKDILPKLVDALGLK